MGLAPPVFHALADWVRATYGEMDLRSYGKADDPASVVLRGHADRDHWVHVNVSTDDDAADLALAADLADRSLRGTRQVFVVASSDKDKVLAAAQEIAVDEPSHEYVVVLGPRLLKVADLSGLTYGGTISELFGQVVEERKGARRVRRGLGRDVVGLEQRRRREKSSARDLKEELSNSSDEEDFDNILLDWANAVGQVPPLWSDPVLELVRSWQEPCRAAWADRFPERADDPAYLASSEIKRLFAGSESRVAAMAVWGVIQHAARHPAVRYRPGVLVESDAAWEAALIGFGRQERSV